MGGGGDGGSKTGGGVELTDAVLTCEGHISDPQLPSKLSHLASCLQTITESDKWLVRKVEPFNSVKVTFSIPKEAAERLYLLAQAGDAALLQLGILSVQVEGDQVISLKVNGPNNEPAEIVLRANSSSSNNEMHAPAGIPRQPLHSFAVPNVVGGQAGHKTPPIPQFRSPAPGTDSNVVGVTTRQVAHPRQVQQGFSFVEGGSQRSLQQPVTQGISPVVQSAPTQRVVTVATRPPAFPSNPPPPYPGQDPTREASNIQAANPAIPKAGPSQVVATQLITAHTQSNASSFRASPGHPAQPNNAVLQTGRNLVRTPMNMVKNSPLLVGLLQSPEQTSPVVKSTKISSLPTPHNISRVAENSPVSPVVANVSAVPSPCSNPPSIPINRSSRESTPTLQQIYPGGSVVTNFPINLPNQLHTVASPKPQVLVTNQIQLSVPKTQHAAADVRLPANESIRYHPVASSSQELGVRGGMLNCIKKEDLPGNSSSHNKKDSQYLINPNTGLLEPRPSTDSSDSEAEGKGSSPGNNSTPSDDESSNGSKKEQGVARTKMTSHKEKIHERETASWHNNLVSSGEKIKLKLKLGREPCAQTTIISNKSKVEKRRDVSISNSLSTLGTAEPRVPKLHIKLHSSQPVIVKSIEESGVSSLMDDSKNTKFRKKVSRNKLREDELKFKPGKHKDSKSGDDISARFLRLGETKRIREGDHDTDGAKVPKLCDDSKITISKTSRADKSRKPRKPVRKIGGLNSLGEIASHKIMETLPPAITKVADLHTQQQSLSPTVSLFSSTSSTRDPIDVKLDDKEPVANLSPLEHPLPAATGKTSSFLSNGDVCGGPTINNTVLNSSENSAYRDSPEGLVPVKKFLKSSVLINKVGAGKSSYSNCVNSYRVVEDVNEKVFKSSDFPLVRTASDITIQSVSKSELISLNKLEVLKPKLESKVGRVLCVDVMDRKALEEALKSSRDSVKKVETSPKDPATSMVDRLRRWNSIDNSSPVPFSSHQTSSDSTNLLSAGVKGETNSLADGENGKSLCEKNSTETSCPRQSTLKVASVNSKSDCDNSCAVNSLPVVDFSQCPEACGITPSGIADGDKPDNKEYLVDTKISEVGSKSDEPVPENTAPSSNTSISKSGGPKMTELVAAKVDVDSPEGTPKGDHGNGQGGEDSGIESMDALSEKSPNHSDQSPHRREDKECDIYPVKCKDQCSDPPVQQKEDQHSTTKESQSEEITESGQTPESNCLMTKEENLAVPDTNLSSIETKPDTPACTELASDTKCNMQVEASDQLSNPSDTNTPPSSIEHNTPVINSEPCMISSDHHITTTETMAPIHSITVNAPSDVSKMEPQISPNAILCHEIKRPLIGSTPISLTTTTIANSSIILQKFLTSSPSTVATTSIQSSVSGGISSVTLPRKVINSNGPTAKPSLLAITLTLPPGSGKINSQYAASLAKNIDQPTDGGAKLVVTTNPSGLEVKSGTDCNSISSSTTAPTMIILATTTNPTSVTNSMPSNSKMVAVKPSTPTTSINPPIGKAFRLVALPGINSAALTPVSNPVRGQIVTLKPVIGVAASATTNSHAPILPPSRVALQSVCQTSSRIETIVNHVASNADMEMDDLDFVGFSSAAQKAEETKERQIVESAAEICVPLMSPAEEDPTPMRVQPPLYTYGNKERKKEFESDVDEKERDGKSVEGEVLLNKLKDGVLDPLTIEIPIVEMLPDDKRLTRTTRQSARLSSPKVNSTSGDLSPHPDKKPNTAVGAAYKQSMRSSVSPALRGTKRRRHESESSNASSVSEDLQDSSSKTRRRKTTARDELLKGRATKFKEAAEKDKVESSDEDGQSDQLPSVNSTSSEDGFKAHKMDPAKDKEAVNLRENVRRASRQKPQQSEKEELIESAENKVLPKGAAVKVVGTVKPKKENVEQSESEAGRRKTRSTTVPEDVLNKRRRQSKEK